MTIATGVLAIDPGYAGKGNACAYARDGVLRAVWFERFAKDWTGVGHVADVVVIERPQQDARTYGVPPEVMIKLAWEGAKLAGAYAGLWGAELVEWTPSEWKGSEPKPRMHARLWEILSPAERTLLGGVATERIILAARKKGALDKWSKPGVAYYPRSFVTHNLLDAVAELMIYGGRLEKRG